MVRKHHPVQPLSEGLAVRLDRDELPRHERAQRSLEDSRSTNMFQSDRACGSAVHRHGRYGDLHVRAILMGEGGTERTRGTSTVIASHGFFLLKEKLDNASGRDAP